MELPVVVVDCSRGLVVNEPAMFVSVIIQCVYRLNKPSIVNCTVVAVVKLVLDGVSGKSLCIMQ